MSHVTRVSPTCVSCSSAALEDVFEALSSGGATEFPLVQPQLTLIEDYSLPLERYDDYEDDEGELRAESNLAEKFGEALSPLPPLPLLPARFYGQEAVSDYQSLTPGGGGQIVRLIYCRQKTPTNVRD